ncbi:hypothetical protein PFLUV_G00158440 [Perca fluviatilis]|uniref:Uncharacterized protein n=1 Tax=Perca fluviatilis TaxID=8168 RepID=A0A6A5ESX1_PERFL|nr:hypothetical protein PFLUV_G00158440 [Perca fluviatilis]
MISPQKYLFLERIRQIQLKPWLKRPAAIFGILLPPAGKPVHRLGEEGSPVHTLVYVTSGQIVQSNTQQINGETEDVCAMSSIKMSRPAEMKPSLALLGPPD